MRAPLPCGVQGLPLFAVLASPVAPVDSTFNILRPYPHARWVFRFQAVDETAACGRFCLRDLEDDLEVEHFGGSLGTLLIAAARSADSVADAAGECIGNLYGYLPPALWKWRLCARVVDTRMCRYLLCVWGFPLFVVFFFVVQAHDITASSMCTLLLFPLPSATSMCVAYSS